MIVYNGTVAVVCFAAGFIVWKMGAISPAFALLDVALGVANAYCAIAGWRRTRPTPRPVDESGEEWPDI